MKKAFFNIFAHCWCRLDFMAVIVFLFTLVSCEDFFTSEAKNLKIPGGEPRLVIYSFISPQDSIIRVHVHRSLPYSKKETQVEPVGNKATVLIAKKGLSAKQLSYSNQYNCFYIAFSEFSVEPGCFYQLNIESFEGEKVSAECYVPELQFIEFNIDSVFTEHDNYGGSKLILRYNFTATANTAEKYYATGAYRSSYIAGDNYGNMDTVLTTIHDFEIEHGNNYIADNSGEKYFIQASTWTYDFQANKISLPNSCNLIFDSIFVYLMQTDQPYYLFHRSLGNYDNYDEDFPFAESVHIYSNIINGLGVFAGYNRKNFYIPVD